MHDRDMTGATRELAMLPLGSVLFPGMPLPLRIFEPRYVEMLTALLRESEQYFGVVLIERGFEVGGGDQRFGVGTRARVASVGHGEGCIELLVVGVTRFEVVRWLQDDPFPRAEVRDLPELECDESVPPQLKNAEAVVRSSISRASEFVNPPWPADIELSPEVELRLWQVAGIAPLNAMDQYSLLRSTSATGLLERLVEDTREAEALFVAGWGSRLRDDDLPD